MNNKRDLLSVADLSAEEILHIFSVAKKLKKELKEKGSNEQVLKSKSLALIFEKQSLRTRISFEIGMAQLGGHVVYLDPSDTGIGVRESEEDIAKVLSGMANVIAARTYSHKTIEKLANAATIPVINALSDVEHPCQTLADILTISEIKGKLEGLTISYIGDGENNVTHSLALGATMLGINFRCGSPQGYGMDKNIVAKAKEYGSIFQTDDPMEAVEGADIVYTDTWVSMGDTGKEERMKIFRPYQVDGALMKRAKKDAIFMHDLPAYRGNEVSQEVIDGPQSVVFHQAENRMHAQKALLLFLLGKS